MDICSKAVIVAFVLYVFSKPLKSNVCHFHTDHKRALEFLIQEGLSVTIYIFLCHIALWAQKCRLQYSYLVVLSKRQHLTLWKVLIFTLNWEQAACHYHSSTEHQSLVSQVTAAHLFFPFNLAAFLAVTYFLGNIRSANAGRSNQNCSYASFEERYILCIWNTAYWFLSGTYF